MNLDIQTEHVAMRPEWHRLIDDWVKRCRVQHPEVAAVDLTLRRTDDAGRPMTEVDAVAMTARRRTVRAAKRTALVNVALREAFDALERELIVDETVRRE